MRNRLQFEQSPYLLQHKDNPVDWYPWGEEAFAKAKREDKPVFLSIGYATCHWCHVMEHESFEDEDVAALMNEMFVSVKVDREERPDIDNLYMTVCQMMTGQGGWPLTILMTPDKKPFYAATYLPKLGRFNRIGMMELLPRIAHVWREQREQVLQSAEQITRVLQEAAGPREGPQALDVDWLTLAYDQLVQRFDVRHGGFGGAPKFPSPHHLLFLLRYGKRTAAPQALRMVTHTLERMRLGGIYDHVGYGFHRYSTDAHWLVPHFEKMLYDQAMLTMAYTEAYQATGRADFARTAREVLTYVTRDMTAPEGGFFSAEDADSEGKEGKFYVWTMEELEEVLGDAAALVAGVYNVIPEGNFEEEATRRKTGENILHLRSRLQDVASEQGMQPGALAARLEAARTALFEHREQRIRPGKDDKILTDWNGLMIAALSKAAQALGEPAYADQATRAADFILSAMRHNGRLLHRYREGQAGLQATVDDYAFIGWGLLELYEATFEVRWLEAAQSLTEVLIEHHWDEAHGAFFLTPADGETLLVRQKTYYDGAVPSGNSVALFNLMRLARITGRTDYEEKAMAISRAASPEVRQLPSAFTALLLGVQFGVGPSYEVVVAGAPGAADTQAMVEAVRSLYVPDKVLLFRPSDEEAPPIVRLAPFTEAQRAVDGTATVYVCRNYQCNRPTTDADEVRVLLA